MRTQLRRTAMTLGATGVLFSAGAALSGQAHAADTGVPALEAIKQCESGGNYQAQNPTSSASGAYQFLTSTWQSLDASAGYATAASAPESVQDAAALELYNAAGTTPWNASASCWSGNVSASTGSGTSSTSSSSDSSSSSTSTSATNASDTSSSGSTSTSSTSSSSGSTNSTSSTSSASKAAQKVNRPAAKAHGINPNSGAKAKDAKHAKAGKHAADRGHTKAGAKAACKN
ncbi:transglycosylase family protein [Dermacoccaceae bacterium W4C1]